MRTRLYTVHAKNGRLEAVADRFSWWALLLAPLWLLWHGLWLTFLVMAALVGLAVFVLSVLAGAVVFLALAVMLAFEGAVFRRLELRLRGWREVGMVEAASAAGAEEAWLASATGDFPDGERVGRRDPWRRGGADAPA